MTRACALNVGESGDIVTFAIPSAVRDHDRVFKVYDAELMEAAKETYNTGAPVRRIPIRAAVTAAIGQPLTIRLTDEAGHEAAAATEFIGEAARKRPLSEEVIRKQVDRLGTSVYELQALTCEIQGMSWCR
jgi:putative protease